MTSRVIQIVCRSGNDFDVIYDERVVQRLCWDEMLGTIATLTHPMIGVPRYRADDADRIVDRMERDAKLRNGGVEVRPDYMRVLEGPEATVDRLLNEDAPIFPSTGAQP